MRYYQFYCFRDEKGNEEQKDKIHSLFSRKEDAKVASVEIDSKLPIFNDSLEKELYRSDLKITPAINKDRSSQMMQKMMKSTQKRNNASINYPDYVEKPFSKQETEISSKIVQENPKRVSHRSKMERENLQGFNCDQCEKVLSLKLLMCQFYNFIAYGTKIKSASHICDKCSRHRDNFPLPSTPEVNFIYFYDLKNFYNHFNLESQDL